jgi:HK97 family phage major capsid protein
MTIRELRQLWDKLGQEYRTLLDGAEDGVITPDLQEKLDDIRERRDGIARNIQARAALEGDELPAVEDRADPGSSEAPEGTEPEDRTEDPETEVRTRVLEARAELPREARRPFRDLGEQLRAVASAVNTDVSPHPRLLGIAAEHRAATGQNEAVGSEGGFLVEQELAQGLVRRTIDSSMLLSRLRTRPVGARANGVRFNTLKENSRADGSRHGGVLGYWVAEAGQIDVTKMEFEARELRLKKVAAMVAAAQEMLDDAAFLEAEISDLVPEELRWQVEAAVFAGDGVGKPLGFRQVPAYIEVAKEGSQVADTVVAENVAKMWGRMPARAYATAIWVVDQSVLPQLPLLKIGDMPVWQPNFAESPQGTILGRPILVSEQAEPVGDRGDIELVDPQSYMLISKGGVRRAVSMHVRFLFDEMMFRFTYRVDGQPLFRQALTPANGGPTLSPFVSLAART